LKTAPGVLAVKVDYESESATIGTAANKPVDRKSVLAALDKIGYGGKFGN
jgi:hypothetical protein